MLPYLIVLFLLLPFIDIYVLIQFTSEIGFIPTLALITATGVIGAAIIQREGGKVFGKLRTSVTAQEVSRNLVEVVLLFMGGIMLLSPGFITDFIGLMFVLRPTRERLMLKILERFEGSSDVTVETYRF